ncbi:hypothetical protein COO60DRAFT_1702897 [Scenedesmus sp. NREL 46B-D3]|nr:hypothetical protein COO60DRAFT_1702897 [Scenedesmus sp. NREL 46B-D3]
MFTYCGPEHWPELRLASKQLAEVGREFIGSITVRSWAKQQVPPPALLNALRHRVKLLHVVGKPDWQKLQRLLSCKASHAGPRRGMPQLRHLILQEPHLPLAIPSSCAALLQGISRLDISCPGVLALPRFAELPGLRAASFACTVSLAQLTQLAPNLDQLWAGVLDCSPGSSGTNNKKSTNAAGAAGVMLARLTHLGCRSLSGVHLSTAAVNSSLEAASAAAAAAARTGNSAPAAGMLFPSLKVLTCLPSIAAPCRSTSAQAAGDSSSSRAAFASCLFQTGALGPCPGLQSVRISGNLGYTSAAAALQQLLDSPVELEQLTRLSLHSGSRCVSAFTCINALSQLQQLQHVTVTGSCSRPGRVALLMDQLALLPQLQSLALPAELLCSQCSSSGASGAVQYALDELMMHSSSLTRLMFLPGAAGRLQQQQHGGSSSNNRSSSGGSSSEGGGGSNDDTSCLAGKCGKTQGSSSASEGSSVGSSSLLHATGGSSSSSSSSRPCRSKACSVCPHPRQVSEKAAMLYSAWQAAAAFEGLSLAADGGPAQQLAPQHRHQERPVH